MRAFLTGCLGALVIAVAAHYVLDSLGYSSENVYSSDNVRLPEVRTAE